MSKKTYSSFPEQQILQEGFRDFLKRGAQMASLGASGMYKRGGGKKQDDQTIQHLPLLSQRLNPQILESQFQAPSIK